MYVIYQHGSNGLRYMGEFNHNLIWYFCPTNALLFDSKDEALMWIESHKNILRGIKNNLFVSQLTVDKGNSSIIGYFD